MKDTRVNTIRWICSTASHPWGEWDVGELQQKADDYPGNLSLRPDRPAQTILGWGGCFNELGWKALQILSAQKRKEILRSLVDMESGLGFTICRMPIGASDFADGWYSLDEEEGDFNLTHFSIDRDKGCLIPYINECLALQPNLKVWGSPWSPPAWMKRNKQYGNGNGPNQLIQETRYQEAYAAYLVRYVTEFQAAGIPIMAVAVQNEPFFSPEYPSCLWTAEELRDFIETHLGPAFRKQKVDAELWLGCLNNGNFDVFTPVLDSTAMNYIDAVGLQWAGKLAVADVHRRYPDLKLVQTESECGDGSCDWKAAEHTFDLIRHYLLNGVSIYDYWNMVLDETGMSHWGWKQNALITVNQKDASVTYTPEYWLFKHFSHYVIPGSVRISCAGEFLDAVAFHRPDGKLVLVAANMRAYETQLSARWEGMNLEVALPVRSFNTFIIDKSTATA